MFNHDDITVIVAAWQMGADQACKFVEWNKEVFEKHNIPVIVVTDEDIDLGESWAECLIYPNEQKIFSQPKTINYGIKRVAHDGIIIKSDPDILFSSALIDQLKEEVSPGHGRVAICANAPNINRARKASWKGTSKRTRGLGACFAMAKEDWFAMKGYHEGIMGWGGDDEMMWRKACKIITMEKTTNNPLYHIKHSLRKGRKDTFPIMSSRNLRVGRKKPWNPNGWGEG